MALFYSAQNNGFYDDRIGKVPSDAVEITVEEHARLLLAQANGQKIVSISGTPTAIDVTETDGERTQRLKGEAIKALSDAGRTIERIIQAVTLGQTAFDSPDVVAWAGYMKSLRHCLGQQVLTEIPTKPDYPRNT